MPLDFNPAQTGTGIPPLLPPGTTTEGFAEATVDKMIAQNPDLASIRDELISAVSEQFQGIVTQHEQKVLNNLSGGNPVLNVPQTPEGAVATQIQGALNNPWLAANPYATFTLLFLELAAEMSKIKLNEGMAMADMTNLTLDMSKDQAELIKAIYEKEAMMHIVAAVSNAVGGACGIGFGIKGVKNWETNGMAWTGIGQGIGQATGAIEKAASAVITLERANLEFMKTVNENAMRVLQDRGIGAAAEAYKAADDVISQLTQALNKIIDEAYRAHGLQTH